MGSMMPRPANGSTGCSPGYVVVRALAWGHLYRDARRHRRAIRKGLSVHHPNGRTFAPACCEGQKGGAGRSGRWGSMPAWTLPAVGPLDGDGVLLRRLVMALGLSAWAAPSCRGSGTGRAAATSLLCSWFLSSSVRGLLPPAQRLPTWTQATCPWSWISSPVGLVLRFPTRSVTVALTRGGLLPGHLGRVRRQPQQAPDLGARARHHPRALVARLHRPPVLEPLLARFGMGRVAAHIVCFSIHAWALQRWKGLQAQLGMTALTDAPPGPSTDAPWTRRWTDVVLPRSTAAARPRRALLDLDDLEQVQSPERPHPAGDTNRKEGGRRAGVDGSVRAHLMAVLQRKRELGPGPDDRLLPGPGPG